MSPFTLIEGDGPVVVSVPHASTFVPPDVAARLNDTGRALTDTDWHVDTLVGRPIGASLIVAGFHRYVIDANRDPTGVSLYPGQATTELVPTTDFDGNPLWTDPPGADEIAIRRAAFHAPYHAALAGELARQRQRHGMAVLFDVHSIRSVVPRLFDGMLADFNVGTDFGATCADAFEAAVADVCGRYGETVVNGRFRGGWTVRHHGRPRENIHAVQLEMAQRQYMDETPPFALHDGATRISAVLADCVARLTEIAKIAATGQSR